MQNWDNKIQICMCNKEISFTYHETVHREINFLPGSNKHVLLLIGMGHFLFSSQDKSAGQQEPVVRTCPFE